MTTFSKNLFQPSVSEEIKVEEPDEAEVLRKYQEKIRKEADRNALEAKKRKEAQDEAYAKLLKTLEKIKGPKVSVVRTAEIESQRSKLPIFAEEQPIVEAINENMVKIWLRIRVLALRMSATLSKY